MATMIEGMGKKNEGYFVITRYLNCPCWYRVTWKCVKRQSAEDFQGREVILHDGGGC